MEFKDHMDDKQIAVAQFHEEFDLTINKIPTIPKDSECDLRVSLIDEELTELNDAFIKNDIIEVADALGDLLYVVLGAAVTCGINLEPIFWEIHRSNMAKIGGTKNEVGKLIKPSTYNPPKLQSILERQV